MEINYPEDGVPEHDCPGDTTCDICVPPSLNPWKQADTLAKAIDTSNRRLREVRRLRENLTEQAHIIDDIETKRADASRTIQAQLQWLDLARHALANGSPHVTSEYLERVYTALDHCYTRIQPTKEP